jgi:20S proteasome alpha/beta subunit
MTVAVGLVCNNGVVLAADTEVTYVGGTGKRYESKIFPIRPEAGCYLTYTGNPDFAKGTC